MATLPHRGQAALEENPLKADELLFWLSARHEGSWQQFRAAVEELHSAESDLSPTAPLPRTTTGFLSIRIFGSTFSDWPTWNSSRTIVRTVGVSLHQRLRRMACMAPCVPCCVARVHRRCAIGCFALQRSSVVKHPILAAFHKCFALFPPT